MNIGTYVEIKDLKIRGRVINTRMDSLFQPIITIELDHPEDTLDGFYIAREYELEIIR